MSARDISTDPITHSCSCGYTLQGMTSGRCPECGRTVTTGHAPPISRYRERRMGLSRDFTLSADSVVVRVSQLLGNVSVVSIALSRIDLDPGEQMVLSMYSRLRRCLFCGPCGPFSKWNHRKTAGLRLDFSLCEVSEFILRCSVKNALRDYYRSASPNEKQENCLSLDAFAKRCPASQRSLRAVVERYGFGICFHSPQPI